MSDIVSFGEWVQSRRNQLRLSRTSLAQQVGCSPVTIKKIERDERRPFGYQLDVDNWEAKGQRDGLKASKPWR